MEPLPRTFTRRRAGKSALALLLLLVLSLAAAQARPASARGGTPTVKITSQPPASTSSTTAAISFTTSNATLVECSLDGGNFFGCVSPQNYAGLSVGKHKVVVRATRDRRARLRRPPGRSSPLLHRRRAPAWPSRPRSRTVRPSPGRPPGRRRRARRSAQVQFYVDGTLGWTESDAPYVFNGDGNKLDTTKLANGSHVLRVLATAGDGTTATTSGDGSGRQLDGACTDAVPSPGAPTLGRPRPVHGEDLALDRPVHQQPGARSAAVVSRPLAARGRLLELLGLEELVVPAGVGLPGRVRDLQPRHAREPASRVDPERRRRQQALHPVGLLRGDVPAVRGRHRQPGLAAVLHRQLQGSLIAKGYKGISRRRRGHGHQRRQRRRSRESPRSTRARASR